MRVQRLLFTLGTAYLIACIVLAIFLGELAFRMGRVTAHPRRVSVVAQQFSRIGFGTTLQDVALTTTDGVRLQALFGRPASANGAAVILLHGVGDSHLGMMGYAEMFLAHGYAVLVPDSRAHGASGGTFPSYGVKEAEDVHEWFSWLKQHQAPRCVFGMGESMGAAVLLQSLPATPFCAVVAESPFASFREIAYLRVGQMFHTGRWLGTTALRPAVELAFLYGKLTRGVYLPSASPEKAVVGSRIPILLIHGLADVNIPAAQSEAIRAHNPADIRLWEVPTAAHCRAAQTAPTEFTERVLDWFAMHRSGQARSAALVNRHAIQPAFIGVSRSRVVATRHNRLM